MPRHGCPEHYFTFLKSGFVRDVAGIIATTHARPRVGTRVIPMNFEDIFVCCVPTVDTKIKRFF